MSSVSEKLGETIDRVRPIYAPTRGKVVSVDESANTCKVSYADSRVSHDKVKLSASPDATIVLFPAIGSIVLVAFADNKLTNSYIMQVSKISKIAITTEPGKKLVFELSDTGMNITVGKGKIAISKDGTTIGDGTAEPMVKGQTLAKWAASVDTAISALIAWGATGSPPGPAGGIAPLSGAVASTFDSKTLSEENTVV